MYDLGGDSQKITHRKKEVFVSWNVKKYRDLIIEKYGKASMRDLEKHITTLQWSQNKILLHKQAIEQCWGDVFSPSIVSLGDKKFKHAYYYSMAEGEAIIHSLHSKADIIAHLINVILESQKLGPDKVYFIEVKKKLDRINIASKVKEVMQGLLNTTAFDYAKAFCNTIKHNCLIDASWLPDNLLKPGSYERVKSAMKFKSFKYKNTPYPAVHLQEICDDYTRAIDKKIFAIGAKLNDFLNGSTQ